MPLLSQTLQSGKSAPAAKIPLAMMLISTGMMFLVVGIAWPHFVSPTAHAGTDWHAFMRGICYGLGFSCDIGGAVLAVTALAAQSKKL
jgi:hypothetical protein